MLNFSYSPPTDSAPPSPAEPPNPPLKVSTAKRALEAPDPSGRSPRAGAPVYPPQAPPSQVPRPYARTKRTVTCHRCGNTGVGGKVAVPCSTCMLSFHAYDCGLYFAEAGFDFVSCCTVCSRRCKCVDAGVCKIDCTVDRRAARGPRASPQVRSPRVDIDLTMDSGS